MDKILEIKSLSKSFGSRRVLRNVTLDIHRGEIVGYLGPNGSGKTTTIKLVLGLLKITHGEIKICGHDVVKDFETAIAHVGGIVENPEMYPYLSARENLRQCARMYETKIDEERINEVLELVGLSSRADDKISKYSLGMKQRLGVAQAILHRPELLVLDEPTNGLDPAGIKDLRDLLKKLARETGLAVFISSHLLGELEQLCDTVAVLNHGAVVGVRSVNELKKGRGDSLSEVEFTLSPVSVAGDILKNSGIEVTIERETLVARLKHEDIPSTIYLLSLNGVKIWSVVEKTRSLEDAFLEMTTDLRADDEARKGASK